MKNLMINLFVSFLIIISTSLYGQKTIKTYYDIYTQNHLEEEYTVNETSAKNGSYKKFDQNGIILIEGSYLNGKKNGVFKYYQCAPGILLKTITYKNDVKNGLEESYNCIQDENGNNISKKNLSITYSNGNWVKEISYFKNGNIEHSLQSNGICTEYYESGKKKEEYTVTNEVFNGNYTAWFENGNIKIQGMYTNENGKLPNGKKSGKWVENNEDGTLKNETVY